MSKDWKEIQKKHEIEERQKQRQLERESEFKQAQARRADARAEKNKLSPDEERHGAKTLQQLYDIKRSELINSTQEAFNAEWRFQMMKLISLCELWSRVISAEIDKYVDNLFDFVESKLPSMTSIPDDQPTPGFEYQVAFEEGKVKIAPLSRPDGGVVAPQLDLQFKQGINTCFARAGYKPTDNGVFAKDDGVALDKDTFDHIKAHQMADLLNQSGLSFVEKAAPEAPSVRPGM